MAENKKSFILYSDLISIVEKLPDEIAGKLFKVILNYVNDKNPVVEDLLLQVAFEPIKLQLKRDLKKFEDKKEKWSEAGKKSAEKRSKNVENKSTDSTDVKNVEGGSTDSTVNDNVTVNVNDNVNVIKEKALVPEMQKIWIDRFPKYFLEKEKDFPALQKISSNIAQLVGVSENPLSQTSEERHQIKLRWGEIVEFISREDFFKNYSLYQVERHFQSILQKEKNGTIKPAIKKATNPKSAGAYEALSDLKSSLGLY